MDPGLAILSNEFIFVHEDMFTDLLEALHGTVGPDVEEAVDLYDETFDLSFRFTRITSGRGFWSPLVPFLAMFDFIDEECGTRRTMNTFLGVTHRNTTMTKWTPTQEAS